MRRIATTSGGVLPQCRVAQNVTTGSCCSLANLPASWYVALARPSCSSLCLLMFVGIPRLCVFHTLPYICEGRSVQLVVEVVLA